MMQSHAYFISTHFNYKLLHTFLHVYRAWKYRMIKWSNIIHFYALLVKITTLGFAHILCLRVSKPPPRWFLNFYWWFSPLFSGLLTIFLIEENQPYKLIQNLRKLSSLLKKEYQNDQPLRQPVKPYVYRMYFLLLSLQAMDRISNCHLFGWSGL